MGNKPYAAGIPGISTTIILTFLRVLAGWHLMYEGIVKISDPRWTSAGYLLQSPVFRWMASDPTVLAVVDFLNEWGLLVAGLALLLGVLTRYAAAGGALLLLMYYIAMPPFGAWMNPYAEGNYFIVDKNLIELFLLVFFVFHKRSLWGIDRLIRVIRSAGKRGEEQVPAGENLHVPDHRRRELIKNLSVLPVLGGLLFGVGSKHGWLSNEEKDLAGRQTDAGSGPTVMSRAMASLDDLEGELPSGDLCGITSSRLILGGNLISGFAHSRDLIYVSGFLKNYFTDEKVIETLRIAEASGINTAILRTDQDTLRILERYRRTGGKIRWLAQVYPKEDTLDNVKQAIDNGAVGAFVQGGIADRFIKEGKYEALEGAVDFIRSQGIAAGTAAHSLHVPVTCEANGSVVQFYMKTLHHDRYWSAHPRPERKEWSVDGATSPDHNEYHDNIWCINPEETAEFMRSVRKPWIAYKVLAAGAIPPAEGFQYVFEKGADFACVGMFDYQVVENVNIAFHTLKEPLNRERAWMA